MTMKPKQLLAAIALAVAAVPAAAADLLGIYRDALVSDPVFQAQRAQRNATIYATCDLALLVIPQAVYLNAWHRPYQRAELVARLEGAL